jgi:tetratricopeptide (TPR) repeat protein
VSAHAPVRRPALAALGLALWLSLPLSAAALDLATLWDFQRPAESERRFREALATAQGDDALVLRTQIARSLGLRRDFDGARRELRALVGALALAREAGLDALAIDAIHMGAFLDPAPADQLRHAEAALAVSLASTQAAARRWEASIRNNLGVALQGLGRHEDALAQFRLALDLRAREAGPDAAATRVAGWMVAHALRHLGRLDEALRLQQRLDRENEAAGTPDPYVLDELVLLHRALGQAEAARAAEARRQALPR